MKDYKLKSSILAFIALAITCLIFFGCSSKKKASSSYNNSEKIKVEASISESENILEKTDCTAVRKNIIDWSAINESLKITPVDPNKPSKTKFTPEANGGWSYETENAEISTSKNQEQKKETYYDSIHNLKLLELERKREEELKAAAAAQQKGREAESDSSRWPFWFLLVPVVLGVLIYFRGWTFWK